MPTIQLGETRPSLPVEIVTAVRDANLTVDDLEQLTAALRDAPEGISPRAMAERVPRASKVITIASRAGEQWLALLAIIVTAISLYIAHTDSQQAHQDAEAAHRDAVQAHQDAERATRTAERTGSLSDEDIRKITRQIEEQVERHRRTTADERSP